MEEMKVVLSPGAYMPVRAHSDDAGYDLFSREDCCIFPNARAKIDTGVHMAIPSGYEGHIRSRSSVMLNKGCITDGTIDSGYTGSISVILFNLSGKLVEIKKGEKIAQIVIEPIFTPELEEVDCLEETERGSGGFGSTGLF
jgi:dUTP pyrophosphatase